MGYMKELQMKYQKRGFGESDKYVCEDCFSNESIKKYIRSHGELGECSYCNHSGKNVVLPLDEVLEPIVWSINQYSEKALNFISWEDEDDIFGLTTFMHDIIGDLFVEIGTSDQVISDMQALTLDMDKVIVDDERRKEFCEILEKKCSE